MLSCPTLIPQQRELFVRALLTSASPLWGCSLLCFSRLTCGLPWSHVLICNSLWFWNNPILLEKLSGWLLLYGQQCDCSPILYGFPPYSSIQIVLPLPHGKSCPGYAAPKQLVLDFLPPFSASLLYCGAAVLSGWPSLPFPSPSPPGSSHMG